MTELRVFTTTILGSVPAAFYWALGLLFLGGIGYLYDNHNSLTPDPSPVGEGSEKYNVFHYWGRSVARLLLVEWIILMLGIAVIFREPRAERSFSLIPFLSYFDYGTNSYFMEKAALNILNVVLFLPVGFLLKLGNPNLNPNLNLNLNANLNINWKGAMAVGLLISVVIEVLQFVFKSGLCEVDDVIHNVLGCMIGYGVGRLLKR